MSDYTNILKNTDYIKKEAKILFISADFNKELVNKLENIIKVLLTENWISNFKTINIPWALEIPAMLNRVLLKENYDLVFCLWVVIRWATTHYEIVSGESARGIMDMTLKYPNTWIIDWILTCENLEQVEERINKNLAISWLNLLNSIQKLW